MFIWKNQNNFTRNFVNLKKAYFFVIFWLFFQDFDKSSLIRNHTIAIRLYYKYHIIDSITRKTVIISRITNLSMRLMIFCFLYNNNNFSKIELRNVVNNIKSIAPQPFQCLIHYIINNIILSLLSWYDMLFYFEWRKIYLLVYAI